MRYEEPGIDVYRGQDFAPLTTIALQEQAFKMTPDAANQKLYVPLAQDSKIAVIDLEDHSLERSIPAYGPVKTLFAANPTTVVPLADDLIAYTGYGRIGNSVVLADAVTGDTLVTYSDLGYNRLLLPAPDGRHLFTFHANVLRRYSVSTAGLALEQSVSHGSVDYGTAFITDDGKEVVYGKYRYAADDLSKVLGSYDNPLDALSGDGTLAAGGSSVMDGATFLPIQSLPSNLRYAAIDAALRQLYFVLHDDPTRVYRLPIQTP